MSDSLVAPSQSRLWRVAREWVCWSVALLALATAAAGFWAASHHARSLPIQILSIAPRDPAGFEPNWPAIPRSRPVSLAIPSIGVDTRVGELGLLPDRDVQVPTTTRVVGWYRYGVTPGQVGSAVILGHVDSYLGPGVFFELKTLRAGDLLDVTLADGTRVQFIVTEVVQYLKTAFPDQLVFGSHGIRSLQLVTCGGVFDHATGHYLSNVVVYSQLKSVEVAKGLRSRA